MGLLFKLPLGGPVVELQLMYDLCGRKKKDKIIIEIRKKNRKQNKKRCINTFCCRFKLLEFEMCDWRTRRGTHIGRNVSWKTSPPPVEVTQHSEVSAKADDRLRETERERSWVWLRHSNHGKTVCCPPLLLHNNINTWVSQPIWAEMLALITKWK